MGTHGGATPQGQREMIEGLGVTEESAGCPIRSGMEVVELPTNGLKCRVLHDAIAAKADGVIVLNRVKPHTQVGTANFYRTQRFQSGLFKMIVIGLGNNEQAIDLHAGNYPRRMNELMPAVARQKIALSTDGSGLCNILGGVAVVENGYEQTMIVEAIKASEIETREPELLAVACAHMPRLVSNKLDVLLLDQTGKNISGTGMDTNIVGRVLFPAWDQSLSEPTDPVIKAIGIHRLAAASHGNGGGMGLADIVSNKFVEAVDLKLTWKHLISANWVAGGKLPVCAGNDAEVYLACVRAAGVLDLSTCRACRIVSTLEVTEAWVSPALLAELEPLPNIEVLQSNLSAFDHHGDLLPFNGQHQPTQPHQPRSPKRLKTLAQEM
eukprot:TRINITY_DN14090_c1_g1_i2.p1 TRINITY_DN14090_c1_g1~~TRINITY_DN14090_c1_g1_i2.p1  ORF type:complete len:381 (-),score=66.21 TRINITY_DN14090_c1_g1_i2:326-1468(-)